MSLHWIDLVLVQIFIFLFINFSIDMACDAARSADVAAVIMHEGLAHICLLTSSMTVVRMRVEMNIPRKRKGSCSQHDKARAYSLARVGGYVTSLFPWADSVEVLRQCNARNFASRLF